MTLTLGSSHPPDTACSATAQRVRAQAAASANGPISPAAADAIDAFHRQHGLALIHWADGSGGAHAFIDHVDLGSPFAQPTTWVAFHLPHTLPDGDIYPLWVRPDLTRVDGGPIGKINDAGCNFLHLNQNWLGEPAVMVSLRSSNRDPNLDSPIRKVARVLAVMQSS